MRTLARARDFGSDTLALAWERKLTALAVIGGISVLAAGGVFLARFLRGRAETLGKEATGGEPIDLPPTKHGTPKFKHGAGSANMAKANRQA